LDRNKNGVAITFGIIGLIVSQVVIRTIGIYNMSAQIIDTILAIVCIAFVVWIYKNRKKGLGIKHNTVFAILVVLTFITIGIGITTLKCYPIQAKKHGILLLVLCLGSYFSLVIYAVIVKIHFDKNNK